MRWLAQFLILAAGAPALGATESASPASAAFGNTIVSTYPDGRTAELWLHPDGSYSAKGRRADPSSGHWKIHGDRICLKQSRPIPVPFRYCTSMFRGGVGATWSGKAVTGEAIRISLVKGVVNGGG